MILPIAIIILGACTNTVVQTNNTTPQENIKIRGIAEADGLISAIKPVLMQSLQSDPTGASGMMICANAAMGLTDNYNKQLPSDSKVRRTALKYRNHSNKPDAKDIEVMNAITTSKNFAPVMVEMRDSYRVYKPLSMAQPCLACHGDLNTMNSQTKKRITEFYPKDLATGFKLGDFRGVVVTEIKK